jgi:hypothetical protein
MRLQKALHLPLLFIVMSLIFTSCGILDEKPAEHVIVDLTHIQVQIEDEETSLLMGASELAEVRFYVVERETAETGVIRGFRSEAAWSEYLDTLRSVESDVGTACDPYSYFYEHQGFSGGHLAFSQPNAQVPSLHPWAFNDTISSLLTTTCGGITTLFEDDNFEGNIIAFGSGIGVLNLRDFKFGCGFLRRCHWNDRASGLTVSF